MPRPLDAQRRAFEEAARARRQDPISARGIRERFESMLEDDARLASQQSREHATTVARIEMEQQQRRQEETQYNAQWLSEQMRSLDQRHRDLCRTLDDEHRRCAHTATSAEALSVYEGYFRERRHELDREYLEARRAINEEALRLPPQANEFPRAHWAPHEGRSVRNAENVNFDCVRSGEVTIRDGLFVEAGEAYGEDDIQPVVVAVAADPQDHKPVAVICANRMMFDRYQEERRIEREAGLEFPRAVFIYSEANIIGYSFSQVETYGTIPERQARLVELCKAYCR